MAFTVEDGSVVPGANSYASVEFADAYATDRGYTDWLALPEADKQVALVRATDYLDRNYTFLGFEYDPSQPLEWPRGGITDENGLYFDKMPTQVLRATVEYARRLATTDIQPDQSINTTGVIIDKETAVGPIKTRTRYASGMSPVQRYSIPSADLLLREFVQTGRTLERA